MYTNLQGVGFASILMPNFRKDLNKLKNTSLTTGEGNGNPLQYSCLENPMDGGAW